MRKGKNCQKGWKRMWWKRKRTLVESKCRDMYSLSLVQKWTLDKIVFYPLFFHWAIQDYKVSLHLPLIKTKVYWKRKLWHLHKTNFSNENVHHIWFYLSHSCMVHYTYNDSNVIVPLPFDFVLESSWFFLVITVISRFLVNIVSLLYWVQDSPWHQMHLWKV